MLGLILIKFDDSKAFIFGLVGNIWLPNKDGSSRIKTSGVSAGLICEDHASTTKQARSHQRMIDDGDDGSGDAADSDGDDGG
jgi:hypothetical protein